MTLKKLAIMAPLVAAAAAAPVSVTSPASGSGALFRLQVTCAAASEAVEGVDAVVAPNAGCEPAAAYVCTTPRADYLDKRPI